MKLKFRRRMAGVLCPAAMVSLCAGLLPPEASAQIQATQGVPAVQEGEAQFQTEFHSPMVLTAPFPLTDRSQWGKGNWSDPSLLRQFFDYRCDGIAISELRMRGEQLDNGSLEVQVKGKIDAIKGHDKRVNLKFDFLNGNTLAASGYSSKIKAPDEEVSSFHFRFTIPAGAVQDGTTMRITFSDYDD